MDEQAAVGSMAGVEHPPLRGSPEPIPGRCGAKLPHTDPTRYCTLWPVTGRVRCKRHGGSHRMGGVITHGRDAAWNRTLGPTWEVLKATPVRDLDTNARVLLSREAELRERLGEGDSPLFRQTALALVGQVRQAGAAGDGAAVGRLMTQLETHLKAGVDRDGVWEQIQAVNVEHAGIVERINRIETRSGNCLTARALIAVLGRIFDLVRDIAGEQVAYRVGRAFDQDLAADLPSGPALQALPPFGGDDADEPPQVSRRPDRLRP